MFIFMSIDTLAGENSTPSMVRLNFLKATSNWAEPMSSVILHCDTMDNQKFTRDSIKIVDAIINQNDLLCWLSIADYKKFRQYTYNRLRLDVSKISVILPEHIAVQGGVSRDLRSLYVALRARGMISKNRLLAICNKSGVQ